MGLRDKIGSIKANTDVMGSSADQKRLRATGKTEVYLGTVKSETARLSKKSDKSSGGRMQIMLQIAPLDGEGKMRFPTVPLFLTVPQPTPPEVFESFNEDANDDEGNPRGQEVAGWDEQNAYDYLKASGREDVAVPMPIWNKTERVWEDQLSDATYKDKDATKPRVAELIAPVHQFMLDSYLGLADKDNKVEEVFKGDTVAFTLGYGKDGTGFPNVKIISGADKVPPEFTVIEDIGAATETQPS